jgi:hypothetical protein
MDARPAVRWPQRGRGSVTTRTRIFRDTNAQAAATAHLQKQKSTCEGCAHLRALRPMCMAETSPHFRMVRGSYQDRCPSYDVRLRQNAAPKPEPIASPTPQPARKRSYVTGDVARRLS